MFRWLAQGSFSQQLTTTLTLGIVVLVLSTSLITSGMVIYRLQSWVVDYARHVTEQFAAQSTFAFLVEDTAVAQQSIRTLLAFPGIRYVAIIRPDYSTRVAEGAAVGWGPTGHSGAWQHMPALAAEEDAYWHFVAPVYTRPLASPYEDGRAKPDHLGYVHIAWDKTLLAAVKTLIVAVNAGISVGMGGFLILWLRARIRRLTAPLSELASVMHQAQGQADGVRARIAGPEETQRIAEVFNALMEKLEHQRASLEAQVAIRTLELREARDAALTAVRYKSEFMAAITHEMRMPLNSIIGYTQLVLEELHFWEDRDPCDQWLYTVLAEAENLLSRINQILDLAKVEAGKMDIRLTWINPRPLVQHVIQRVQPLLRENRNRLQVAIHGPEQLLTDEDKLSQILLNLLSNAGKFTQAGTIVLQIRGTESDLMIEVRDTGIGIPLAQQALIFEPFRQVDMSDTRRYPGTGLGLAITKRFCELLGGTIRVQSQVGVGSTFTVRIPLPSGAPGAWEPHSVAAALARPEGQPDSSAQASAGRL